MSSFNLDDFLDDLNKIDVGYVEEQPSYTDYREDVTEYDFSKRFDVDDFLKDLGVSSPSPVFDDRGFNIDFLENLGSGGDLSDYSNFDAEEYILSKLGIKTPTSSTASSRPNLFQKVMSTLGINAGSSPIGGTLAALALTSALRDRGKLSPKVPQVGYQGEVPKLTAIRERIERDDTGRRPGSAGRRYFSDVIYAKRPEGEERMTVEEARAAAKKQAEGLAKGGSVLQGGGYLEGDSDGQADLVKGNIDGVQEARLSHGEFVLPADVVAMLGNGNSDAGADALQDFMKSVRTKATGNPKQQKNIDADKVLAMLSKRAKA
jgi:hypothetical protein